VARTRVAVHDTELDTAEAQAPQVAAAG